MLYTDSNTERLSRKWKKREGFHNIFFLIGSVVLGKIIAPLVKAELGTSISWFADLFRECYL